VTHVTVNCAFYGNRCDTIVETLDAMPTIRPLAQGKWEGHPVHLYELHSSSAPSPAAGSADK
jgi:hypothetical protein